MENIKFNHILVIFTFFPVAPVFVLYLLNHSTFIKLCVCIYILFQKRFKICASAQGPEKREKTEKNRIVRRPNICLELLISLDLCT